MANMKQAPGAWTAPVLSQGTYDLISKHGGVQQAYDYMGNVLKTQSAPGKPGYAEANSYLAPYKEVNDYLVSGRDWTTDSARMAGQTPPPYASIPVPEPVQSKPNPGATAQTHLQTAPLPTPFDYEGGYKSLQEQLTQQQKSYQDLMTKFNSWQQPQQAAPPPTSAASVPKGRYELYPETYQAGNAPGSTTNFTVPMQMRASPFGGQDSSQDAINAILRMYQNRG